MALQTAELESSDRSKVHEQAKDKSIDSEIIDTFVPQQEPSVSPNKKYKTCSELEKLMDDDTEIGVEVGTRRVVTDIVEQNIEDAFAAGHGVQEKCIKTLIRKMTKGAIFAIVEQGRLDAIWIHNIDMLGILARFIDILRRQVVGNKSFFALNTAFVKKKVD